MPIESISAAAETKDVGVLLVEGEVKLGSRVAVVVLQDYYLSTGKLSQ